MTGRDLSSPPHRTAGSLTGDRSPVGLQIVGSQFGEERVLGIARCISEVVPIGNPPFWLHQASCLTAV